MRIARIILKGLLICLLLPVAYFLFALILSWITVGREDENQTFDRTIYLSTNGVHLEVVLPVGDVDSLLRRGLRHGNADQYLSFGWGDEEFYLNTPSWSDMSLGTAFRALFWKSTALLHVTRYPSRRPAWVEIKVSARELRRLNAFLRAGFDTDSQGRIILLEGQGYTSYDDFYRAKGSYSCFRTCNSWINQAFKESGLKACLWTPFDFGLMNKYQ